MNKKIVSILILLVIFVSIALTYTYINYKNTYQEQYNNSDKTVNNEDLANEVDSMFIDEDSEIEIGDVI